MKKRMYLAAIAMCVMLTAAGCGGQDKKAGETTENTTETTTEKAEEPARTAEDGSSRLVSVDNLDKYITLSEYKGIVLDKSVTEVTDEDVEKQIQENLKNSAETVSDSSATVQNGDTVTINFVGKKDGVAFDGGSADNYDLVIGDGTMIPGFEEGIVGMKKGETKDIDVTFPDDYSSAELAGADAVFQITVQSFKRPPELTDEWAAANTDSATADAYRASVRALMEENAETMAESSLRSTAWTTVYTNSEVMEYPEKDIEDASAEYRRQVQAYADQAKMELEDFVVSQGVSMEDFEEQGRQYAEAKVKQLMVIQAIMDAEGISLEDEASLAIQDQLVQQYGGGDLAKLIDMYGQAVLDQNIGMMRVQDFIIANANIEQGTADKAEENKEETAEGEAAETDTEADADAGSEEATEEAAADSKEE